MSKPGATIIVTINGVEEYNVTLPADTQLKLVAEKFKYLKPGDTINYAENGISKTMTVPDGFVLLVKWELISPED